MRRWIVVLLLVLAACSSPPDVASNPPAELRLTQPRAVHRATPLADGRVLITGGCTEAGCGGFDEGRRADVYTAPGGIARAAEMTTPRASGTATLLADGDVLLTGGYPGEGQSPTASAEVFRAASGRFEPVAELRSPRADHSATLLPDGRVLIAGGFDASGTALSTSEVFDPATGTFSPGPDLSAPRAAHVATRVEDQVVLLGGTVSGEAIGSTDVWRSGTFTAGPSLLTPRVKLGAATLADGRVLVVGGSTETEGRERLASTELLDLDAGTVSEGPELSEGEYKLDGAVAVLADGRVVVPSGGGLDVLDLEAGEVTALPGTTYDARSFRTVTPVGPDSVLVAGGYDDAIVPTDLAVVVRIPRTV